MEAQTATCPHGQSVTGLPRHDRQGRPFFEFHFERSICESCPLFERCVRSKTKGRSLRTHPYEAHLQAARERQQTDEFKQLYRRRSRVERKIAELVRHGLRRTRYRGQAKRQLQRLWTGAAVNLKRLVTLAEAQGVDLVCILLGLNQGPARLAQA